MNSRQVLFAALMAMVVAPAFGNEALVFGALKTAVDKHSNTTGTLPPQLPTPTDIATAESKTLMYGTTTNVDIKKEPLVTVSDAPCKQACKNLCKVELTKSCSTVPVVSKVCTPSKKTLSKQVCSKKCTLSNKTPKESISDDTPSNANPSTPPTDVITASSATLDFHKDASLSAGGITADLLAAKGRRLSGLVAALAAKASVAAEMTKSLPVPACDDVCETVTFEVPDIKCHEVTHETEICKMVPSNNCQQECVCIPQKTFALNLPEKVLDNKMTKP